MWKKQLPKPRLTYEDVEYIETTCLMWINSEIALDKEKDLVNNAYANIVNFNIFNLDKVSKTFTISTKYASVKRLYDLYANLYLVLGSDKMEILEKNLIEVHTKIGISPDLSARTIKVYPCLILVPFLNKLGPKLLLTQA